MELTSLERAALDAIVGYEDGPLARAHRRALSAVLANVSVSERTNTGVGFYTHLMFDAARLAAFRYPYPIDGPLISLAAPDEPTVMCFLLWLNDRPVLEGVDIGGPGDPIDLTNRDLYGLRGGAMDWFGPDGHPKGLTDGAPPQSA